ncbi:hypothetical protein ABPG74_020883 [Tetrahymena malaccensis]
MIKDFSQNLFDDQIYNSKIFNVAVVQSINSQVQKIAWHLNMITQLQEKQLQSQVRVNKNFKPALLYSLIQENNDNKQVISIFRRNPPLVSSWMQSNYNQTQKLNETSKEQIYLSSHIDFMLRSIKYDDNQENFRWMQFTSMFFGFSSDGMLYGPGTNGTIKGFVVPPGCPYNVQPFLFDIRCRFYYQPTVNNISITVFPPSINFNKVFYFASNICQRIKKYQSQDPNSESSVYGILCSTLNLKLISTYFVNFSKNSIYQRLLDPRQLSLVYDSNLYINQTTLLQDVETNYLQDQQQAQYYLEQINANSKFILQETDNINLSNPFYNSQNTFQYNRNGTECFVILNSIQMIDKIPKQETQKSINPAKKYQLKNVFLFTDVLSKKNMLVYAQNLEDTIIFYNKIFLYTSWGIIFLILFVQIIYSIQIGFSILEPVIHLRNIIDQIKILNQKQPKQQSILISNRTLSDVEDEILIDDQLDRDFDGYCLSSETQDLLNSFQNMFQTLKFTTKKLFGNNQSTSLLNLNDQLSHFKQFGNLRALGICYNNIGLCALCFDLINQVLFKEEDSFGLLNFNFEEQIFIQNIGVTFIKTISSNIQLFYEIFMELFLKKDSQQQQVNITEQKQLGISQQTEFIKESHNSILNRQNSIQQREKQYSKCYQDSLKNKGVPSPENQNFQQKQDEQPTEYSVISLFNTEPFEKISDHSLDIKEDGSKSQEKKNMFTISQTNNFKQGVETKNSFEFSDNSNNEIHNLIRNSQEDTGKQGKQKKLNIHSHQYLNLTYKHIGKPAVNIFKDSLKKPLYQLVNFYRTALSASIVASDSKEPLPMISQISLNYKPNPVSHFSTIKRTAVSNSFHSRCSNSPYSPSPIFSFNKYISVLQQIKSILNPVPPKQDPVQCALKEKLQQLDQQYIKFKK